jgi:hypothetical protein
MAADGVSGPGGVLEGPDTAWLVDLDGGADEEVEETTAWDELLGVMLLVPQVAHTEEELLGGGCWARPAVVVPADPKVDSGPNEEPARVHVATTDRQVLDASKGLTGLGGHPSRKGEKTGKGERNGSAVSRAEVRSSERSAERRAEAPLRDSASAASSRRAQRGVARAKRGGLERSEA